MSNNLIRSARAILFEFDKLTGTAEIDAAHRDEIRTIA